MGAIPPIPASPTTAARAYQATQAGGSPAGAAGSDFGGVLARALEGAVRAVGRVVSASTSLWASPLRPGSVTQRVMMRTVVPWLTLVGWAAAHLVECRKRRAMRLAGCF